MSSYKLLNQETRIRVTNKKHNLQIVEADQGIKTLQLEIHIKTKVTSHRMLAMIEEIDHQLLIILELSIEIQLFSHTDKSTNMLIKNLYMSIKNLYMQIQNLYMSIQNLYMQIQNPYMSIKSPNMLIKNIHKI